MEKIKLVLCPDCCYCPEVEFQESNEVVIRDDTGGAVRLPKSSWNALVTFVKEGKLKEL